MPVASGGNNGSGEGNTVKTKKKVPRHSKTSSSTTSHFDQNAQLLEAIGQGKSRVVRRLLDSRADPNYQGGPNKACPLMQACEIKDDAVRESIFELLLNKGADLNLQDVSGQTVLMKAILNGIPEVTRLIKLGADVRLEDIDGNLALNHAAEAGDTEWTHLLVREGKRKGAHIDHQNLQGNTPLLLATHEGHLAVAKVLVESGASASKRDLEHFMTPLEWMKLSGCYAAHELEFLGPSSKKKDFYRRERMKKGIKTLTDYLPTIEDSGPDSPNVFTLPQPDAFHGQFPVLPGNTDAAEEPSLKSMFDVPTSQRQQQQQPHSLLARRRSSISFPAVSKVKTDLYNSSYLSRRKSMLLKNSMSEGYHSGALAPLGSAPPKQTHPLSARERSSRLPPINKS
jgi:hypothetical protein